MMAEEGHKVEDPRDNFVQFLMKDITYAMVGNKRIPHGEILLKAISHFGMVRVPRDRVTQIIREEFLLDGGDGGHERFAYYTGWPKTMATSSTIRITSKWCWDVNLTRSWTMQTWRRRSAVML